MYLFLGARVFVPTNDNARTVAQRLSAARLAVAVQHATQFQLGLLPGPDYGQNPTIPLPNGLHCRSAAGRALQSNFCTLIND